MALFDPADYRFADAVSRLAYCNPFLPERVRLERLQQLLAHQAEIQVLRNRRWI